MTINKKSKMLPNIYSDNVQERLSDVYIDLFYEDSIPSDYFIKYKEDIKDLYLVLKYLLSHYPDNIDEYCEYAIILFFDETYTIEKYLEDRFNHLSNIIKFMKEKSIYE